MWTVGESLSAFGGELAFPQCAPTPKIKCVDLPGIEPGTEQCECPVIPLYDKPVNFGVGVKMRCATTIPWAHLFVFGVEVKMPYYTSPHHQ